MSNSKFRLLCLLLCGVHSISAYPCGPVVDPRDVTNIKFHVNDTTFANKTFEIHKTANGWSLADGDDEIYFDNDGNPCLSAPEVHVQKCGETLKNHLEDSKGSSVPLTGLDLATSKQKLMGFAKFGFQSKRVSIFQHQCEENVNSCLDREKPFLSISGRTFKDADGKTVHSFSVQVMRIGSTLPLSEVSLQSSDTTPIARCLSPVDDKIFLKGKAVTINNLNDGKSYVVSGASVSEHLPNGSSGKELSASADASR